MNDRVNNAILSRLTRKDLNILIAESQRRQLTIGQIIEPKDVSVEHVYFPESGVASVVATGRRGKQMETGPVGREGMSGLPIVHQVVQSPTETVVQIAGEAICVPARIVANLMQDSPEARIVFLRYSYAFSLQAIHTALTASLSGIEIRLARWLLMLHDRVDGDEIAATHDFMAMMLAVRRPSVTTSLHLLEGKRLIRSMRKVVRILDRRGMEELCGDSYGRPEREYRRVLGDPGDRMPEL